MSGNSSTYASLKDSFSAGKVPGNLFLVCADRVLADELTESAFDGFVGKGESRNDSFSTFTAEDLKIESLMNEAIGGGLFSVRKLIVLRNPGKLNKARRTALTEYLASPNPDVCMMIISAEDDAPAKILLEPSAGDDKHSSALKNLKTIRVSELSEEELINWVNEKFDGFEISDDSVNHLLSLSNKNLEEILPEIEKLKTYCHFKKSVSMEDINLCNGIDKEFSEGDFLKAVIMKDPASAFRIYNKISLKRDMEVYLVFLLNTAFCAIRKLKDPASSQLQGFPLKKELKLWGPVQESMLPLYREYASSAIPGSPDKALNLLYDADKKFKSSSAEKSVVMTNLIHNLCTI